MKELTIEQKARAYDKSLERAKKLQKTCDSQVVVGWCEYIFPVLKESEDERIRKWIKKELENKYVEDGIVNNVLADKAFAWLEKQGTPKQVSIWKHWKDGIAGNGEGKPIYLVKIGNTYSLNSCLGFECDYIELSELDNLMLEKQGHTDGIIEKAKTEKQRVIITETDGNANIDWDTRSLEDARKLLECGLQYINTEIEKQSKQKETLCGKCKKEHPSHSCQDITELGRCAVEHEQKPAEWKQENVEELSDFENAMMHIGGSFFGENAGLDPNDTVAIKEQAELLLKLAPKTEWGEEDEKIRKSLLRWLQSNSYTSIAGIQINDVIAWLKSLRPQINVTDKELAQARKEAYNEVLDKIEYHDEWPTFDDGWNAAIWYLKKRNDRPQSHWKPNDDQMHYLISKEDYEKLTNGNGTRR